MVTKLSETPTPPTATKTKITAILGISGADAMAAMGLTTVPDDQP